VVDLNVGEASFEAVVTVGLERGDVEVNGENDDDEDNDVGDFKGVS
jgi:hypothetical protein